VAVADVTRKVRPQVVKLFENYHPNTFDVTAQLSVRNGKPDTLIVTGDIAAMWLQDYTAQLLAHVHFDHGRVYFLGSLASKDACDKPVPAVVSSSIRRQCGGDSRTLSCSAFNG